jgi:hypothetical protein
VAINYDGRRFRTVVNAETGNVTADTVFSYHQRGNLVWATYEGGGVQFGTLVALADEQGILDMRYQHVSQDGQLMTGVCRSVPEILPDGRLRLHETWQWTCGDHSCGTSVIEEISG